jgi:hypothetical protein
MNVISKAEADILLAIEGADRYPYRCINDHGADRIVEWLDEQGWPTYQSNIAAWIATAEKEPSDEIAVLEIPARSTKSGRPETLELDDDCFQWRVDGFELHLAIYRHLRASGPDDFDGILAYCQEQVPGTVMEDHVRAALADLPVEYDENFDAYQIDWDKVA